jgi:hypothetical protein
MADGGLLHLLKGRRKAGRCTSSAPALQRPLRESSYRISTTSLQSSDLHVPKNPVRRYQSGVMRRIAAAGTSAGNGDINVQLQGTELGRSTMLMTTDKAMFLVCDACRVRERSGDLAIVWRQDNTGKARQCYTVHEACLGDLVRTVLLTEEEMFACLNGELTVDLVFIPKWNFSIDLGPAGSASATVGAKHVLRSKPAGRREKNQAAKGDAAFARSGERRAEKRQARGKHR